MLRFSLLDIFRKNYNSFNKKNVSNKPSLDEKHKTTTTQTTTKATMQTTTQTTTQTTGTIPLLTNYNKLFNTETALTEKNKTLLFKQLKIDNEREKWNSDYTKFTFNGDENYKENKNQDTIKRCDLLASSSNPDENTDLVTFVAFSMFAGLSVYVFRKLVVFAK